MKVLNCGNQYTIKVKVYIGSAFVESDPIIKKILIDDLYPESARTYLFNKGNVYDDLTGGWSGNNNDYTSITSENMSINSISGKAYFLSTNKKINTEGFTKLIVVRQNYKYLSSDGSYPAQNYIGISEEKFQYSNFQVNVAAKENAIGELDLSDSTLKDGYIYIEAANTYTTDILQVLLVK